MQIEARGGLCISPHTRSNFEHVQGLGWFVHFLDFDWLVRVSKGQLSGFSMELTSAATPISNDDGELYIPNLHRTTVSLMLFLCSVEMTGRSTLSLLFLRH